MQDFRNKRPRILMNAQGCETRSFVLDINTGHLPGGLKKIIPTAVRTALTRFPICDMGEIRAFARRILHGMNER